MSIRDCVRHMMYFQEIDFSLAQDGSVDFVSDWSPDIYTYTQSTVCAWQLLLCCINHFNINVETCGTISSNTKEQRSVYLTNDMSYSQCIYALLNPRCYQHEA